MVGKWRRSEKNIPKQYELPLNGLPGKWVMDAKCSPSTGDIFFSTTKFDQNYAKQLCSGCPVLLECRAWALDHKPEGVWGGTTEDERNSLVGRRTPLRPSTK